MKIKNLLPILLALVISGCNQNRKEKELSIEEEIVALKTTENKKDYLETIFYEDQKVRGSHGSEIMLKSGKDSDAYRNYVQTQIDQDALNLKKIEKYFTIHGYPQKSKVGELAAQTPWAVIHHSSSYEDRERNFAILYQAYLNGDIDDGAISMFLGRMYEIKNGERLQMESPFKSEDEINLLIKELNLEEKKANARQRL